MVAVKEGDHLSNCLADGNFARLVGGLPRLLLNVANQPRNVPQERRVALKILSMVMWKDWRRRRAKFSERLHHAMGLGG